MLHTILRALVFGLLVQQPPAAGASAASLLARLSGTWKAEQTRIPRATDLDVKVFGAGAMDVRDVTLTIQPTGQGTFTLAKSVVGRNGRRYAPSVIEATLTVGDPVAGAGDRLTPAVSVTRAEERYLDGDHERWPIEGARVSIIVPASASGTLEFRFDTQSGRDSFGTTLHRSTPERRAR